VGVEGERKGRGKWEGREFRKRRLRNGKTTVTGPQFEGKMTKIKKPRVTGGALGCGKGEKNLTKGLECFRGETKR